MTDFGRKEIIHVRRVSETTIRKPSNMAVYSRLRKRPRTGRRGILDEQLSGTHTKAREKEHSDGEAERGT